MGTSNIDIALLRTFVAVADHGRMTVAARIVHLSQGAVSQQIKRLEALFGTALFERGGEVLTLTAEGERLLPEALGLIAHNDEVMERMRGSDFTGEVKLGLAHDMLGLEMRAILGGFRRDFPDIGLTLVSESTEKLRSLLRMREIDLALLAEMEPGPAGDLLSTDELVWVGATRGEAYLRRPLPVAVCNDTRCGIRAAMIETLARAGIAWRAISHLGDVEPVFDTIEADMAVTAFLGRDVPNGLSVLGRESGLPLLSRYHINLRQSAPGQPAGREIRELARHIRLGFVGGS